MSKNARVLALFSKNFSDFFAYNPAKEVKMSFARASGFA